MSSPKINPLDLDNKRILITGASSGIGRETARLLDALNARLVLAGRNIERLQEPARRFIRLASPDRSL